MYRIADDSPVTHAVVDGLHVKVGDEPVELTAEQATRVEALGVKLTEASSTESE